MKIKELNNNFRGAPLPVISYQSNFTYMLKYYRILHINFITIKDQLNKSNVNFEKY
jgi:hypothetical protein